MDGQVLLKIISNILKNIYTLLDNSKLVFIIMKSVLENTLLLYSFVDQFLDRRYRNWGVLT